MKLLTKELCGKLPPLYADEQEDDPMVICKFFPPWGNWAWYAIEFDGKDTFFGLVDGLDAALGYFSLSELESVTGPFELKIERDLSFKPCRLSIIREQIMKRE